MRSTFETADDAELLGAIQHGDEAAVAELYDRYGGAAYGLAYRITGDAGVAEDAVQDGFVSLWKQAARFETARGNARSWLMTMVHHRAIDAVRRRSGRNERALPEGPGEPLARRGLPEELATSAIEAEAVRQAMAEVPDDQRRTIELAYFSGLTHVEIAQEMGVPPGTVKSRLRLGLNRMRVALGPEVRE